MKTEKYLINFKRKLEDKKQAKTKQEYIDEAFKNYSKENHKVE